MTGPVTVPEILSAYVTVDDEGIKLNPRGADGLAVAVLVLPEKKYASWHDAAFPRVLDKALKDHFRTACRLFFLVKDMPDNASTSFDDNGAFLFLSGYSFSLPVGDWAAENPKELPVVTYADVVKMMGGPKTAAGKSQSGEDEVKAGRPEPKPKQPIQSSDGVSMQMTGDNEIVGAGKKKAVSAPKSITREEWLEELGVKIIPDEQFRELYPKDMREAKRWGLVNRKDKKPIDGIGGPEWDRDFETVRRLREYLDGKDGHRLLYGYDVGGCSNYSTEKARDPDHGNLTAEEAKIQGKPVGALYMRPDPRYGWVDYDHALDKTTRELRQDLPDDLKAEIEIMAAACPTEVSVSGTGLHVLFEKREGWPEEFTKNKQTFPQIKREDGDGVGREVFGGFGYVIPTGDRWKKNQRPATQEQKDAAYEMVLGIVNDYLRKKGKRAGPVARPAGKSGNGCGGPQEPARKMTKEEMETFRTWMYSEAKKVKTHMTEDKNGDDGEKQASEAMMSILSRIMEDAAENAHKHGVPYEFYARPKIIQMLWERSETFKKHYKSGEHDYNVSKIAAAVGKAIDAGRQKYNELSRKAREGVKGEQTPECTPEQAVKAVNGVPQPPNCEAAEKENANIGFDDILALDSGNGLRETTNELVVGEVEEPESRVLPPWDRKIVVNTKFEDCGARRKFDRNRHKFTDEGNACRFEDECKGWLIFDKKSDDWFGLQVNHWEYAEENVLKAVRFVGKSVESEKANWTGATDDKVEPGFERHVKYSASRQAQNAILAMAKANMTVDLSKVSNPHLIACKNGIFDSKAGEFYPLEDCDQFKTQYPMVYIDAEYTAGARSEKWINHLETVMDDNTTYGLPETERKKRKDELVNYLLRLFGYVLYAGNPERIFLWLYGNGRNGKSTTMEVLVKILGDQARKPSLTQLFSQKTDSPAPSVAAALPCRLAVFTEASGAVPMDESAVKEITGEAESERFRGMRKDNVKVPIYCLPIATTNDCPQFDKEVDYALLTRLVIIPFKHLFEKEDRNILNELVAEKDKIFSMMVDECRKYQKEGLLPVPNCAQMTRGELMAGPDRYRFLTEVLEPTDGKGDEQMMTRNDVAEAYLIWATDAKVDVGIREKNGGKDLTRYERNKLFAAMRICRYQEVKIKGERGFRARKKTE